MELRNVRTFIKVAELLNFSKAALVLGYTQSTVSIHIKQLEEEFRIKLFERFGKNVRLTVEGTLFLPLAERISASEKEASDYMLHQMEPQGTLILGSVNSIGCYVLPPILLAYHKIYPRVNIVIKSASMEVLFDWLEHNEIDILCAVNKSLYSTKYIKIYEQKTSAHFVVSAKHPLARKAKVSLGELLAEDFILTEDDIGYRKDLDELLGRHGKSVTPFIEVGDAPAILACVENSNAVTFLPRYIVRERLEKGTVKLLPVDGIALNLWIHFIYLHKKWVTPQMKVFGELLSRKEYT